MKNTNKNRRNSFALLVIMAIGMLSTMSVPVIAKSEDSYDTDLGFIEPVIQQLAVPSGYTGIYTAQDLDNIRYNPSGDYILMNDIDLNGFNWVPIGGYYDPETGFYDNFSGVLDGQGYIIKNLRITSANDNPYEYGLFSRIEYATIKNIGLVGTSISMTSALCAGSICSWAFNSTISNCYNTNDVLASAPFECCWAGGLIGVADYSTIRDCYNTGSVSAFCPSGPVAAGGIVGWLDGSISNCYSTGSVAASTNSSSIWDSPTVGGIIAGYDDSILNNCYCLNLYDSAKGTQLTSAQMRNAASFVGFDFDNVWNIDPAINDGYPFLRTAMNDTEVEVISAKVEPSEGVVNTKFSFTVETSMNATKLYMYTESGYLADEWEGSQHYTDDSVAGIRKWEIERIISTMGDRTLRFYAGDSGGMASGWKSVSFKVKPGIDTVSVFITNAHNQYIPLGEPYAVNWVSFDVIPDYVTVMVYYMGNEIYKTTTTKDSFTASPYLLDRIGNYSVEIHPYKAAHTPEVASLLFNVAAEIPDISIISADVLTPDVVAEADDFVCEIATSPNAGKVGLRYENGGVIESSIMAITPDEMQWKASRPLSSVGRRLMSVVANNSAGQESMPKAIEVNVHPQDVAWAMAFDPSTGNLNVSTNDSGAAQKLNGVSAKLVIREKGFDVDLMPSFSSANIINMPYSRTWNVFRDLGLVAGQTYEAAIAYLSPFVSNYGGNGRAVYKEIGGANSFTVQLGMDLPRILRVEMIRSNAQGSPSRIDAYSETDFSARLGESAEIHVYTTLNVGNIIMSNSNGYRVDLRELARKGEISLDSRVEGDELHWSFEYKFSGLYDRGSFKFIAVHNDGMESAAYDDGRVVDISFRPGTWSGDVTANVLTVRQIGDAALHFNDVNQYSLWIRKAGTSEYLYYNYDKNSRINLSSGSRHLWRKWSLPDDLFLESGTFEYGVRGATNLYANGRSVDYKIGEFTYDGGAAEGLYDIRYIGEPDHMVFAYPSHDLIDSPFEYGDAVYVDMHAFSDDIESQLLTKNNWARICDTSNKSAIYYIERKVLREDPVFTWPVPSSNWITSGYGWRINPESGKQEFHTGIDIGESKGKAVIASLAGTVIYSKDNEGGYGNHIIIEHHDKTTTLYGHLSKRIAEEGDQVQAGETIGEIGNSGQSRGFHLHFEIRENGKHADPDRKSYAHKNPDGTKSVSSQISPIQALPLHALGSQPDIWLVQIDCINARGDIIESIVLDDTEISSINNISIPYSTALAKVMPYRNSSQIMLNMTADGELFEPGENIAIQNGTATIVIEATDADSDSHNCYSFILSRKAHETSADINGVYLYDADHSSMDPPVFAAEGDGAMSLTIPKSINSISLVVATESPYAQVSLYDGNLPIVYFGEIPLAGDDSEFTLRVAAEDGSEQEYTLNVVRSDVYSDNTDISAVYISACDADGEYIYPDGDGGEEGEYGTIIVSPDQSGNIVAQLPANTAYYYAYVETADYYAKYVMLADGKEVDFSKGGIVPGAALTIRVTAEDGATVKEYQLLAGSQGQGVAVIGEIRSYNPGNPATIRLMQGGEEKYRTAISGTQGFGQAHKAFGFNGVAPGAYSLVVTKPGHTSFTVQTVVVGDEDVDLTQDSRPETRLMELLCGDINGDNMINSGDLAILWRSENFNKSAAQAAEPLCDLDGDGMVNSGDLAILWLAANFNKGAVVVE